MVRVLEVSIWGEKFKQDEILTEREKLNGK